jgi:hypothetical protein
MVLMLLKPDACSFFSPCVDWGKSIRTGRFGVVKSDRSNIIWRHVICINSVDEADLLESRQVRAM